MANVLSCIVVVIGIGNIFFNIIRLIKYRRDVSEKEQCIGRIKMFGWFTGFMIGTRVIAYFIHQHYDASGAEIVVLIMAILLLQVMILGLIIEYEEIKWAP